MGGSRQEREKIRICILGRGINRYKLKELSGGTPQGDFVHLGSWSLVEIFDPWFVVFSRVGKPVFIIWVICLSI